MYVYFQTFKMPAAILSPKQLKENQVHLRSMSKHFFYITENKSRFQILQLSYKRSNSCEQKSSSGNNKSRNNTHECNKSDLPIFLHRKISVFHAINIINPLCWLFGLLGQYNDFIPFLIYL